MVSKVSPSWNAGRPVVSFRNISPYTSWQGPCSVRHVTTVSPARPFISGKLDVDESSEQIEIIEPGSGNRLSSLHLPTRAQVEKALKRSNAVFEEGQGCWSHPQSIHKRYTVLTKLGSLLHQSSSTLAELESRQTGRSIREMKAQLSRVGEWFEYYASLLRTSEASLLSSVKGDMRNEIRRRGLGVVLHFTPFNHPLLIAIKKLAPALAAGNSVIVKPPESTPFTVLQLAQLAKEAGVPDDVLQILPGRGQETGHQLLQSDVVRKVDLTGGTSTGRALGSTLGLKLVPFTAELGGKAPFVVFPDSSLDLSVAGALFASFIASGQTCVSATRIVVHQDIYEDFVKSFVTRCKEIEAGMGDPLQLSTSMGSLISRSAVARVDSYVKSATQSGLEILTGGEPMRTTPSSYDYTAAGTFYPPTVISASSSPHGKMESQGEGERKMRNSAVWKEEIFGPVICILPFKDENHAVELANDCDFSLGASVWCQDHLLFERLSRRIHAGIIWHNCHHRNDPASPWHGLVGARGGTSSASGIGVENGWEALLAYSQSQSIIVNLSDEESRRQSEDWFGSLGRVRYG